MIAPKAPPIVFLVLIKCSPLSSLLQKITTNLTNPDLMSLLYHNDTIIKKEKELLRALLIQFCKLEVVDFLAIENNILIYLLFRNYYFQSDIPI